MPSTTDRVHHAIGTDGDEVFGVFQRHRLRTQSTGAVRRHGLHDVADEGAVLRAGGVDREAGGFVAAPDDGVGGVLDFLDFVAVANGFVAGEVNDLRPCRPHRRADGEQDRVAQTATDQRDGGRLRDVGGRSGGAHQHHPFAGAQQGAEVGRSAHLQRDDADQPLRRVGPGAGHRQALHAQDRVLGARGQDFMVL